MPKSPRQQRKEATVAAIMATEREKTRKANEEANDGGLRRMARKNGGGRCAANKRDGGTCKMPAGFGTVHIGIGRCKYHGGNAPNHVKAAIKAEAVFMGAPKEINPVDALYWCIKITAGEIEWLSEQMAELERTDWLEYTVIGKQLHIFAKERQAAVERLAKFSKDAISLGLAERAVRLAENYGSTIARLLKSVLDGLQLSPEQAALAPSLIRQALVNLERNSPVVPSERPSLERAS